jgi:hypothetical protein
MCLFFFILLTNKFIAQPCEPYVCERCNTSHRTLRSVLVCNCNSTFISQGPVITPNKKLKSQNDPEATDEDNNYEEADEEERKKTHKKQKKKQNSNYEDDSTYVPYSTDAYDSQEEEDEEEKKQTPKKRKRTKRDAIKIIKKVKASKSSTPRRKVDTHPITPKQVKDETSERAMYTAMHRFVKVQSILTPSAAKHRGAFAKVQAIAIVIDDMIPEPDKCHDSMFRRDTPQVNFLAPNDMTKEELGILLVKYGRALQGHDAEGGVLDDDDDDDGFGFEVNFTNSGDKKSANEVLNNIYGKDANLEKKYGPKPKK